MEKIKTTSFWLGLSGTIVIVLDSLSKLFGFEICSEKVEGIIITICSVLVVFGFVNKHDVSDKDASTPGDLLKDLEDKNSLNPNDKADSESKTSDEKSSYESDDKDNKP